MIINKISVFYDKTKLETVDKTSRQCSLKELKATCKIVKKSELEQEVDHVNLALML